MLESALIWSSPSITRVWYPSPPIRTQRESLDRDCERNVPSSVSPYFWSSRRPGNSAVRRSNVACGMISALFAVSVDPGALVRALMAWCRLPARIGHALFAAMQLVPDLASELQQMRLARAMKSGARLRRIPGPREALSLLIPLLAYAIRRAGRIAIAMEARGLSPGPRTIMHVPSFSRRDAAFALAAAGLILLSSLPALLALPLSP